MVKGWGRADDSSWVSVFEVIGDGWVAGVGMFLTTTALRDVTVGELLPEIQGWFDDHFIVCTEPAGDERPSAVNCLTVYAPHNGWTTVVWPTYFGGLHSEMAEHLSSRLRTVASSIDVYHSETWQHVVYDNGSLVDEYATDPSYLVSDLDDARAVARRWRGNPDAVVRHISGSARKVARHYRHNRSLRRFDEWSFTELWADLGILYPGGEISVAATLVLPDRWEGALRRTPH
jgi:hypothetical protein